MSDSQDRNQAPNTEEASEQSDDAKITEEAILKMSGASAVGNTEDRGRNVDALFNVKLDVRVVLGHNRMPVSDLLKLTRGSVIELDRKIGDPVDLMINDRLVARGDLIKIEGDLIGVALREIVKDFAPGE